VHKTSVIICATGYKKPSLTVRNWDTHTVFKYSPNIPVFNRRSVTK